MVKLLNIIHKKEDEMNIHKTLALIIFILFILLMCVPVTMAGEDEYGKIEVKFGASENITTMKTKDTIGNFFENYPKCDCYANYLKVEFNRRIKNEDDNYLLRFTKSEPLWHDCDLYIIFYETLPVKIDTIIYLLEGDAHFTSTGIHKTGQEISLPDPSIYVATLAVTFDKYQIREILKAEKIQFKLLYYTGAKDFVLPSRILENWKKVIKYKIKN